MESRQCPACGHGIVLYHNETIAIRQDTDRGPLAFDVAVPVGRCTNCDKWRVTPEGEATIDLRAREAYESLRPNPRRRR